MPIKKNDKDFLNYKKANPKGNENDFIKNWPRHLGISPKTKNQKFEIMIGAILTQNTSWLNVEKAIYNLNKNNLVDPNKMLKANKKKICSLIRCAGYYNQKAERLKIISKFFLENENHSREQLLNVKGVGPETADSILLYAFGKNHFVVDAYTKRIFSRLGIIDDSDYNNVKTFFENNIDKKTEIYKQYHALIVEHAKRFCRTKPECEECVLNEFCKKRI
jgi:endonuclease-3 related protein